MEHALGVSIALGLELHLTCLNPYCNGTCSRSFDMNTLVKRYSVVLILIVMEHALGECPKALLQNLV